VGTAAGLRDEPGICACTARLATRAVACGSGVVRSHIWEKRHFSSSLDRDCDEALMSTAGAGLVARPDLSLLGEIAAKQGDVLVIDVPSVVLAERAPPLLEPGRTRASFPRRPRCVWTAISTGSCHGLPFSDFFVKSPPGPCDASLRTLQPAPAPRAGVPASPALV
jgi:hypothetical protein